MKIRIASIVLAVGLLCSLMSVAFANDVEEPAVALEPEVAEEVVEEEKPAAVFYLDGEPLYDVVAQCIGGTYYVTLASMMPLIDENAVVEGTSEMATLTAQTVVVTDVKEEAPAEENAEDATAEEFAEACVEEEMIAAETEPFDEESAVEVAVAEVVDSLTLTAEVGDQYLVANGRYLYAEGGVITLEEQVAVPVRLLAEALNLTVGYDSATGFVTLESGDELGYLTDGEAFYDEESLYWLSRIIYSESGNQSLAGKIAVGNVVLNRVNNPAFPDTIYDVIFQKNQFSPAGSGSIYRDPRESSIIAAKLVLDGAEVMEDALFFNRVGLKCFASRNRTFIATIGGHSFYA